MMMTRKYLFFICTSSSIAGCTAVPSSFCELRGGAPYVNFGGYQFCGKVYEDGGKTCYSSAECEGECVLPWDWKPDEGLEVVGRCEADSTWEPIYGCVPVEHYETYTGGCIEE